MSQAQVALLGSKGRMGQAILRIAKESFASSFVITKEVHRNSNLSAKELFSDDVNVVLDVSLPEALCAFLEKLPAGNEKLPAGAKKLPALIVGSTGWTATQSEILKKYAERAPVIHAPNFSPSVNLFLGVLEQVAPKFKEWGYEVSLHEWHHSDKLDAPSGTGNAMITRLKAGGLNPQVSSVRAGKIIGTHSVSFIGPQDIFEMRHEALDRDIFAKGALVATKWILEKRAVGKIHHGFYTMKDVVLG